MDGTIAGGSSLPNVLNHAAEISKSAPTSPLGTPVPGHKQSSHVSTDDLSTTEAAHGVIVAHGDESEKSPVSADTAGESVATHHKVQARSDDLPGLSSKLLESNSTPNSKPSIFTPGFKRPPLKLPPKVTPAQLLAAENQRQIAAKEKQELIAAHTNMQVSEQGAIKPKVLIQVRENLSTALKKMDALQEKIIRNQEKLENSSSDNQKHNHYQDKLNKLGGDLSAKRNEVAQAYQKALAQSGTNPIQYFQDPEMRSLILVANEVLGISSLKSEFKEKFKQLKSANNDLEKLNNLCLLLKEARGNTQLWGTRSDPTVILLEREIEKLCDLLLKSDPSLPLIYDIRGAVSISSESMSRAQKIKHQIEKKVDEYLDRWMQGEKFEVVPRVEGGTKSEKAFVLSDRLKTVTQADFQNVRILIMSELSSVQKAPATENARLDVGKVKESTELFSKQSEMGKVNSDFKIAQENLNKAKNNLEKSIPSMNEQEKKSAIAQFEQQVSNYLKLHAKYILFQNFENVHKMKLSMQQKLLQAVLPPTTSASKDLRKLDANPFRMLGLGGHLTELEKWQKEIAEFKKL